MKHGSLFSGIGGFDLAAHWMGWENVFHCEWMEFPRKVLDYYFPEADSHVDICKTDFRKYANKIDILTGGFPCQPFSMAGKRKGTEDERYLWDEMLRTICEVKPKYVIAENVFGITNIDGGLVFEKVWSDLEVAGYEVQPFIIPASAKNAPHRRDRVWFIAYSDRSPKGSSRKSGGVKINRSHKNDEPSKWRKPTQFDIGRYRFLWNATNPNSNDGRSTDRESGCEKSKTNKEGEQPIYSWTCTTSNERNVTNTDSNGLNKCDSNNEVNAGQRGLDAQRDVKSGNEYGNVTNSNSIGRKNALEDEELERKRFSVGNKPRNWHSFPTESPICGGNDGLPTELDGITFSKWRNQSIKGYGNAIVPQVALEIFKVIQEIDNQLL